MADADTTRPRAQSDTIHIRCRGAKSFVDDLGQSRGVVLSRAVHFCDLLRLSRTTRRFVRFRRTRLHSARARARNGNRRGETAAASTFFARARDFFSPKSETIAGHPIAGVGTCADFAQRSLLNRPVRDLRREFPGIFTAKRSVPGDFFQVRNDCGSPDCGRAHLPIMVMNRVVRCGAFAVNFR